jgi:hypothetical protein
MPPLPDVDISDRTSSICWRRARAGIRSTRLPAELSRVHTSTYQPPTKNWQEEPSNTPEREAGRTNKLIY